MPNDSTDNNQTPPAPPSFFDPAATNPDPAPMPPPPVSSANLPPPEDVPPIPPNYEPPHPKAAPVVRPSPFRLIIPILLVVVVVVAVGYFGYQLLLKSRGPVAGKPKEPTTITYWGLWETAEIMKPVIEAFQADNPDIKVSYQMQSHADYQQRVMTQLDSGSPADVVRIHSTWLPLMYQKLIPAPANTITSTEIKTNFYPAARQVIIGDQVYGVPITMESLALYVNTKMFSALSLSFPKTWEDVQSAAKLLTDRDPTTRKIKRSGIALGTTNNIDNWPDIVSLMLLQGGANLLSPADRAVAGTLKYYASFAQGPEAVWDATMPNSTEAFANEKVAMFIGPIWKAIDIQTINRNLEWKAIPVPQLPEVDPINWTSYWIESVPKNSKHPQEAWRFVTYLSSAKAQQLLFESATKARGVSQPPANKAVAKIAQQNSIVAPFVESLPTAQTFYTASMTHDTDNALNFRLIKYLEDAVNTFAENGGDNPEATSTLILGFNQVLSQYRLVTPIPQPVEE